jgi:hypothetical protein
MFEYRITKYNPKNRDTQGRYIDAAIKLLDECGVSSLAIDALENHLNYQSNYLVFSNGQRLRDESLREGIRSLLRGDFWCRLQDGTRAFIHVGYDYYMYIGVPCPAQNSVRAVQSAGFSSNHLNPPTKSCLEIHNRTSAWSGLADE